MEPLDPETDRGYLDDLDRFWDDLIADAPVTPLNLGRADAIAVRDLHEAGSALNPDAAFVARLRSDLLSSPPRRQPSSPVVASIDASMIGYNVWQDRFDQHPRPEERHRRFGHWLVTHGATAAIVLLTVGAIYFALGRQPATPALGYTPTLGGGIARTGNVPGPGPAGSPVIRWSFETGNLVLSTAAISSGVIFVGSTDAYLYAIDAETGTERWRFPTVVGISSSPAVVDGTVFVGAGGPESNQGMIYAVDSATGKERWHVQAGAVLSSPAVVGGVVYVGSNDRNLYALDAATGQVRWTTATAGVVVSSPAVEYGTVYVGSADGSLYAVAAETGSLHWQVPLDDGVAATPAVASGIVYIVSDAWTLYAIDAATGETRWQANGAGEPGSIVAVANGVVYVAGQTLQARDAATGETRWTFRFGKWNYDFAAPVIAEGVVYLAGQSSSGMGNLKRSSSGLLFAVDAADGTERWRLDVGAVWLAAPAVVDGVAYVSADAKLVAVGEANGAMRPAS